MSDSVEFAITRASQLTIPNKDWTHYRSGLKLRCSTSASKVTLEIISQGKSIDITVITSTNVRFLTKEPIVGLKVFDSEKLRKRLQLTFAHEGHFNMFANKVHQWLGLSVVESYNPNSQSSFNFAKIPSNTQLQDHSQTLFCDRDISGNSQEDFSRISASQSSFLQSSQMGATQTLSQTTPQNSQQKICPFDTASTYVPSYSHARGDTQPTGALDPFSLLLNAAANQSAQPVPSQDMSMLSQSTQVWNPDVCGTLHSLNNITSHLPAQGITGADITRELKNIPLKPSRSKKIKSSARAHPRQGLGEVLEATILQIIKDKQDDFLDFSDEELALKIARRLKSKSFLNMLKRVENLLDEL